MKSPKLKSGKSEQYFWDLITQLDWPNNYSNYLSARVQYELCSKHTIKEISDISAFTCHYYNLLSTKVDQYIEKSYNTKKPINLSCSDDGFNDLLEHSISLGKDSVLKDLEDPQRIVNRGNASEYEEGFFYLLPSSEDYDTVYTNRNQYLMNLSERALDSLLDIESLQTNKEYKAFETLYSICLDIYYGKRNFNSKIHKIDFTKLNSELNTHITYIPANAVIDCLDMYDFFEDNSLCGTKNYPTLPELELHLSPEETLAFLTNSITQNNTPTFEPTSKLYHWNSLSAPSLAQLAFKATISPPKQ